MKQSYPCVKTLCTALTLLSSFSLAAQNPTHVSPSNNCNVVETFNEGSAGFRSPSIFTESSYTQFNWENANGYWIENTGQATRSASLISPVYVNEQLSGAIDIGFKYAAGVGGEYRIRVLNVECSCIGGYDIIATTAFGDVWTPFPDAEGRICIRMNDADILKGQKLRFEISYRNQKPVDFIFDDLSLGQIAAAPLPVTFMGIVASRNKSDVRVTWEVAQEINVKEYAIEKSTDGASFITIGAVPASGKNVYSFNDLANEKNAIYYRLKNIDFDGRTKYSGIIKVNGTGSSYGTTLKLYPVPARNQITMEHKKLNAGAMVTITTMDGSAVKKTVPAAGSSHTPIDITTLAPGTYLIQVNDGAGSLEVVKMIKM